MSEYACPRCNYQTPRRCLLVAHLRRKFSCRHKNPVPDEKLHELLRKLESEQGRHPRTRKDDKTFVCNACKRTFNFSASLSRHKKSCTSSRHEHDTDDDYTMDIHLLRKKYDALELEVSKLRDRATSSTTHNTIVNTYNDTNNSIQINGLGSEDISGITPELIDTCIRRTTKGLVELIEKIHFDTYPSNNNLRASLSHPEQVQYHDGCTWKYGPKNRVVKQIVDSGHLLMSNRYDESQDELRKSMSNALYDFVDRWMHKMTRANAQVYIDVMSEVYCAILNRTRNIS